MTMIPMYDKKCFEKRFFSIDEKSLIDFQIVVWARREPMEKGHTSIALEIALKSVAFYQDYFNTSEPVPPKIGQ